MRAPSTLSCLTGSALILGALFAALPAHAEPLRVPAVRTAGPAAAPILILPASPAQRTLQMPQVPAPAPQPLNDAEKTAILSQLRIAPLAAGTMAVAGIASKAIITPDKSYVPGQASLLLMQNGGYNGRLATGGTWATGAPMWYVRGTAAHFLVSYKPATAGKMLIVVFRATTHGGMTVRVNGHATDAIDGKIVTVVTPGSTDEAQLDLVPSSENQWVYITAVEFLVAE